MDFNILRFGLLGDEDVGEDDGNDEENDNDNHALLQPTLGLAHPFNTTEYILLGALGDTAMMMVVGHKYIYFSMLYIKEVREIRILVAVNHIVVEVLIFELRDFTLFGST